MTMEHYNVTFSYRGNVSFGRFLEFSSYSFSGECMCLCHEGLLGKEGDYCSSCACDWEEDLAEEDNTEFPITDLIDFRFFVHIPPHSSITRIFFLEDSNLKKSCRVELMEHQHNYKSIPLLKEPLNLTSGNSEVIPNGRIRVGKHGLYLAVKMLSCCRHPWLTISFSRTKFGQI